MLYKTHIASSCHSNCKYQDSEITNLKSMGDCKLLQGQDSHCTDCNLAKGGIVCCWNMVY